MVVPRITLVVDFNAACELSSTLVESVTTTEGWFSPVESIGDSLSVLGPKTLGLGSVESKPAVTISVVVAVAVIAVAHLSPKFILAPVFNIQPARDDSAYPTPKGGDSLPFWELISKRSVVVAYA